MRIHDGAAGRKKPVAEMVPSRHEYRNVALRAPGVQGFKWAL